MIRSSVFLAFVFAAGTASAQISIPNAFQPADGPGKIELAQFGIQIPGIGGGGIGGGQMPNLGGSNRGNQQQQKGSDQGSPKMPGGDKKGSAASGPMPGSDKKGSTASSPMMPGSDKKGSTASGPLPDCTPGYATTLDGKPCRKVEIKCPMGQMKDEYGVCKPAGGSKSPPSMAMPSGPDKSTMPPSGGMPSARPSGPGMVPIPIPIPVPVPSPSLAAPPPGTSPAPPPAAVATPSPSGPPAAIPDCKPGYATTLDGKPCTQVVIACAAGYEKDQYGECRPRMAGSPTDPSGPSATMPDCPQGYATTLDGKPCRQVWVVCAPGYVKDDYGQCKPQVVAPAPLPPVFVPTPPPAPVVATGCPAGKYPDSNKKCLPVCPEGKVGVPMVMTEDCLIMIPWVPSAEIKTPAEIIRVPEEPKVCGVLQPKTLKIADREDGKKGWQIDWGGSEFLGKQAWHSECEATKNRCIRDVQGQVLKIAALKQATDKGYFYSSGAPYTPYYSDKIEQERIARGQKPDPFLQRAQDAIDQCKLESQICDMQCSAAHTTRACDLDDPLLVDEIPNLQEWPKNKSTDSWISPIRICPWEVAITGLPAMSPASPIPPVEYCYKKHNYCPYGYVDCGAGCASSSNQCASTVADQVIAPLSAVANFFTAGLFGKVSSGIKKLFNVAESATKSVGYVKQLKNLITATKAYKEAKAAWRSTEKIRLTKKFIDSQVKVAEIAKKFQALKEGTPEYQAAGLAAQIEAKASEQEKRYLDAQERKYSSVQSAIQQRQIEDLTRLSVELISLSDPTGIANIVTAYTHKTCEYP